MIRTPENVMVGAVNSMSIHSRPAMLHSGCSGGPAQLEDAGLISEFKLISEGIGSFCPHSLALSTSTHFTPSISQTILELPAQDTVEDTGILSVEFAERISPISHSFAH